MVSGNRPFSLTLLHQLAFRPDSVEHLEQCAQQPLRRNRGTVLARVELPPGNGSARSELFELLSLACEFISLGHAYPPLALNDLRWPW